MQIIDDDICTDSILEPHKQIIFQEFSLKNCVRATQHLTIRLFKQSARRPSGVLSNFIQPFLWLILFGGLFQNIALDFIKLDNSNNNYGAFLSCGIIIFTSFTGSLNAGIPLMFDREFGFLNRLLASPIELKYTIITASTFFIISVTIAQNLGIMLCSLQLFSLQLNFCKAGLTLLIILLITGSISNFSIGLAFVLPGHIEFLALILVTNLPVLFASTALVPIWLMPNWLQLISKCNLLTYATEGTRLIIFSDNMYKSSPGHESSPIFSLSGIIMILTIANCISFLITKEIIGNKIE